MAEWWLWVLLSKRHGDNVEFEVVAAYVVLAPGRLCGSCSVPKTCISAPSDMDPIRHVALMQLKVCIVLERVILNGIYWNCLSRQEPTYGLQLPTQTPGR
jgi:hypothetical protein